MIHRITRDGYSVQVEGHAPQMAFSLIQAQQLEQWMLDNPPAPRQKLGPTINELGGFATNDDVKKLFRIVG